MDPWFWFLLLWALVAVLAYRYPIFRIVFWVLAIAFVAGLVIWAILTDVWIDVIFWLVHRPLGWWNQS